MNNPPTSGEPYAPDLPGLGVVGDTLEEVRQLVREGIALHLESLKEHGEPIPKPGGQISFFANCRR